MVLMRRVAQNDLLDFINVSYVYNVFVHNFTNLLSVCRSHRHDLCLWLGSTS